jgi:hypothetical protein
MDQVFGNSMLGSVIVSFAFIFSRCRTAIAKWGRTWWLRDEETCTEVQDTQLFWFGRQISGILGGIHELKS